MRCGDAVALAAERATLDRAAADAVTAHLADCPACAATVSRHEAAVAQLRGLPLREPPPGLEAKLLSLPRVAAAPAMPAAPLALGERWVWLLAVAATALTAWSLWQARVNDPDGRVPGALPPLADAGGAGDGRQPAGAGPAAFDGDTAGRSDAAAEPTAVARLRPLDLRRLTAPDAVTAARRPVAAGVEAPSGARPTRGPRGGWADRTAATPVADEGAAAPPPSSDRDPAPAAPPRPPDAGAAAPTAAPPAAAPIATATGNGCDGPVAAVRVRVAADVAGGGDGRCQGCDGTAGADDVAALVAAGGRLPSMQIGYYAQGDGAAFEQRVVPGGAGFLSPGEVVVELPTCQLRAEHWPLTVVVRFEADAAAGDWAVCPGSRFEIVLDRPDAPAPTVLVHPVCPAAPPPTTAPSAPPPTAAGAATDAPDLGAPPPPAATP